MNNRPWTSAGAGGFDLYDVSNPARPKALVRGFGDRGGEGALTGTATQAHEARSVFAWQAGRRAYLAVADATEGHSLDIFEITNPKNPVPVREYDLTTTAPGAMSDSANDKTLRLEDVVVKRVGSRFRLFASFFDGGYIRFNATVPAALQYEADSDFGTSDPLTGFDPGEGNAHQAELGYDNRLLLTAENDSEPYRGSEFDGWGYMSLYSTTPDSNGKFPLLDAHAIKESLNPDYASGFGDLSISEQAVDPTEPLSYASYSSGGLRVFSFETRKITEQGAFIAEGGNDFWGVEQFTARNGQRYIAASDRDFGLFVFRYRGPLAPARPTCRGATVSVRSGGSVLVPVRCTDANGNRLKRSIARRPGKGSLGPIDQRAQKVRYRHRGGGAGRDSFTFRASDGAASSAAATIRIRIVA